MRTERERRALPIQIPMRRDVGRRVSDCAVALENVLLAAQPAEVDPRAQPFVRLLGRSSNRTGKRKRESIEQRRRCWWERELGQMNEMLMTIICFDKPLKVYFHIIFCSYLLCKFPSCVVTRPVSVFAAASSPVTARPNNYERDALIRVQMKVGPGSICFFLHRIVLKGSKQTPH